MEWRNDHGAECCCFACVMDRAAPYAFKKPGRGGRHKVVIGNAHKLVKRYGAQTAAAEAMGVSRMTIIRRLREERDAAR